MLSIANTIGLFRIAFRIFIVLRLPMKGRLTRERCVVVVRRIKRDAKFFNNINATAIRKEILGSLDLIVPHPDLLGNHKTFRHDCGRETFEFDVGMDETIVVGRFFRHRGVVYRRRYVWKRSRINQRYKRC